MAVLLGDFMALRFRAVSFVVESSGWRGITNPLGDVITLVGVSCLTDLLVDCFAGKFVNGEAMINIS